MDKIPDEDLVYHEDDEAPDIGMLADCYTKALLELGDYFRTCRRSYDDRRNIWPGKTDDLRKNNQDAFPWQGASDQESNVVGERLDLYSALFAQAFEKSHIKAFATSAASMPRAAVVSAFLKWMKSSYIPNLKAQMELGGNYLLEKGLMVTYVGWQRESRTFLQSHTLDDIAAMSPELAQAIMAGDNDEEIAANLTDSLGITVKRAKKALRQLRTTGEAHIPVPRMSVDCPFVHSCAPDGEVFLPNYVTDPQRSPQVFWRTFLTAQELEKKVMSDGWDRDWVDHAIANLRGKDNHKMDGELSNRQAKISYYDKNDLVMVVHAYQRLIDEEDGSEGIYCTVFHPDITDSYASHELLNGHDDYPFVFTRLTHDQKRMYESEPMSKNLRGPQWQIKAEIDARVDRASIATLPPLMHPAGRPPGEWRPGAKIPYRRLGEIAFGPPPPHDNGSMEVEITMRAQADRAVGLDIENPLSMARQQFYVSKYLDHVRKVLELAWKLFQRLGPDEVFFQVSGISNPQTITKGDADEVFSISIAFDNMSNDPETAEMQLKQLAALKQWDVNGLMDMGKLLEFAAHAINPMLADSVMMPHEEAAEKMAKDVTDDLAKIYAGIEVPARPNGAQAALQIIQNYAQQEDIAEKLQNDVAFAGRLGKYAEQYQFMMQQGQNAEIGKIGTNPAAMGDTQTQNMSPQ
jgi:hypothetical protein